MINNFEIKYEDQRTKELGRYFKRLKLQFIISDLKYNLKRICRLQFKKRNSAVNLNNMIDSIDKKVQELYEKNTKVINDDYSIYFNTRLITLSEKNYNTWKEDVDKYIKSNNAKWKKEADIIFRYTPFMSKEKMNSWLYYIASTIEKLSNNKYSHFVSNPEIFIVKNINKFNNLYKQ